MEEGYFLPRKEKTYTREIWAVPDKESGKDREAIVVEVEPQGLTKEQVKELLAEETARMENYIIGANSSLQEVRTDLNLIREIEGTPVTVDWELDSYEVLNLDGSIRKEKVTEEGTIVRLTRPPAMRRIRKASTRHMFGYSLKNTEPGPAVDRRYSSADDSEAFRTNEPSARIGKSCRKTVDGINRELEGKEKLFRGSNSQF